MTASATSVRSATSSRENPGQREIRLDGAKWILEGVKDGKYRTVVCWCPDVERRSAEEIHFAEIGVLVFDIAGHKRLGGR